MTELQQDVQQLQDRRKTFSKQEQERRIQEGLDYLESLSAGVTDTSQSVNRHSNSDWGLISIHESVEDEEAARIITRFAKDNKEMEIFEIPPSIKMRPHDGAVMMQRYLSKIWGHGASGLPGPGLFGSTPPQQISVQTGPDEWTDVYWGLVNLPRLKAEMLLQEREDNEYGQVFYAQIKAPKAMGRKIKNFWLGFREFCRDKSIYRGFALEGVGEMQNAVYTQPRFIDIMNHKVIDPSKVAYPEETFIQLRDGIWGRMKTAEIQRKMDGSLNRKVLLKGEPGVGKTLGAMMAMQFAVKYGWTAIKYRIGDDLDQALLIAKQLAPSLVVIEDVDSLISTQQDDLIELLERFDGISAKDREVMMVLTTNFTEDLVQTMLRPGRIDQIVNIPLPDRFVVQRLVENKFKKGELAENIDWDAVFASVEGYTTSFVVGAFNDAKSNAIVRTESEDYQLTTEDLVTAAKGLTEQKRAYDEAAMRPAKYQFGDAMVDTVRDAVGGMKVLIPSGEITVKQDA